MDKNLIRVTFLIFSYIYFTSKSVLALDNDIIETPDFQNCSSFTSTIPVKICCCKVTEINDCAVTLNITWDLLKQYRIPRTVLSKAPKFINLKEHNFIEGQLNCRNEDTLRYTLPTWDESNYTGTPAFSSYFSPDGYLQVNEYAYSAKEYCIESIKPDAITVVACDFTSYCTKDVKSETNGKKVCLFRCCNYGEVWDISRERPRCASSGVHKWKPEIYLDTSSNEVLTFSRLKDEPVTLHSHPRALVSNNCKTNYYTFHISNPDNQDDNTLNMTKYGSRPFKILSDGTVWMKTGKFTWVKLDPGEYCIDGFQYGEGTYSKESMPGSLLFECKLFESDDEIIEHQRRYSISFGIIIFVCLLFLLMTEIVYILLWSKHNIHGWTVFSYITTLLVTYLLLGISHFASSTLEQQGMQGRKKIWTFCGILGVLCHFAFLCTFSWSTVLSFDLFCTFRTLRPTRRNVRSRSHGVKKFLSYCVFAVVLPTFIVSTGVFLDVTYSMDRSSDVITPEYGKFVCYVDPRHARVYYVILPIAIFLGINFLLFCNTAFSVYKMKKSTQLASSSSTKKQADHQTLRLILKLLLVNGVVWIVEIISWYLQTEDNEVGLISFTLDVVNIMQAVAIFFLFVFKDDILESLRKMYPSLEGTINVAFKVKYWGRLQRPQENVAATSTDTTYSIKTNSKMPVTRV